MNDIKTLLKMKSKGYLTIEKKKKENKTKIVWKNKTALKILIQGYKFT